MTTQKTDVDALTGARTLADLAAQAVESAIASAARLTDGGKRIDDFQPHAERIAQLATEAKAAEELLAYAEGQASAGQRDALAEEQAFVFAAEVVSRLRNTADAHADEFGLDAPVAARLEAAGVRIPVRIRCARGGAKPPSAEWLSEGSGVPGHQRLSACLVRGRLRRADIGPA